MSMRTNMNENKMWGKPILRIVLSICVFLFIGNPIVWAETIEVDGVIYDVNVSAGEAKVVKGIDKDVTEIHLQEEVELHGVKYPVTCIGYRAFYNFIYVSSVVIPNSVVTI